MRTPIALVALTPLLFGCVVHTDDHVVMGLRRYPHARTVEFTPSDAQMRRLVIRSDVGDVTLTGGADANRIFVRLHERLPNAGSVSIEGGVLVLDATERDALLGDVTIEVASELVDVVLDSGSGEIALVSAEVSGRVELSSGSGNVRIETLTEADEVEIDAGAGDVSIEECDARSLVVGTGAGDVSLRRVRSDAVRLDTGLGDIVVEESVIGALDADTGLGDIDVLGGRVDSAQYDTGLGSIESTP
jgi:hypothetical protein